MIKGFSVTQVLGSFSVFFGTNYISFANLSIVGWDATNSKTFIRSQQDNIISFQTAGDITFGNRQAAGNTLYATINSNGLSLGNSSDVTLSRDAANIFAQRRGTNAQTKRIYGTYTDASNYRRVAIAMTTGGVASIAPEGAGTGASGNVLHISGLPTANPGPGILWNNGGTVEVGT